MAAQGQLPGRSCGREGFLQELCPGAGEELAGPRVGPEAEPREVTPEEAAVGYSMASLEDWRRADH